ncbi:MAG: nitrite reductase, copper-containing [Anaerolineales bacterium]|nr:nitrite reductase, copper-containing [Anaerolineales bacterium]
MSTQTNQTSELPWDRRPVTSRDMAILIGILVLACIGGAALIAFSIRDQSGAAVADETSTDTISPAEQQVTQGSAALGQTVFETQCAACHTIGAGDRVGPDLQGVTGQRDEAWLARWIAEPDKVLAEGDPIATELLAEFNNVPMPNLQLSTADVQNVIAYLENPASGESVAAASGPTKDEPTTGENIVHHPADIPQPVGDREPQTIQVDLEAIEVVGQLADGATYNYFTFNGTVPGPMLRVRVGDTVELTLRNAAESHFPHSIDLHAVNGPGGGHIYTETNPGEENSFTFKTLAPGIYVYHCATPSVPHHITNGMYGLILVEPEGGLPPVDHEFYVMQGEIYTAQAFGSTGELLFSADKLSQETPEYYVFNGAAGALTQDENVLQAAVGETVRIFFGVGGPNKTSSFHVIGEIFDRAYNFGSLTSPPLTDVQTVTVPPGGAWMVEFQVDVPGTYLLVDHALSRSERGLVGYLVVDGEEQPEIIHEGTAVP